MAYGIENKEGPDQTVPDQGLHFFAQTKCVCLKRYVYNGTALFKLHEHNRSSFCFISLLQKVHVKKVWSPIQPPTSPAWQNTPDIPGTDPEVGKTGLVQIFAITFPLPQNVAVIIIKI